ncbi:MAG: hypothetical protein ACREPB_09240 [Arenimonas sp.]
MATINFHDEYLQSSILRVAFLNPYRCTGNKIMTFYEDPSDLKIKVDANHPFTFRSTYIVLPESTQKGKICTITITVPITPDREYRVVTNAKENTCTLKIDIKQNDGTWVTAPGITERKPKTPWLESQGFCVADERFKDFDNLKN